MLKLPSDVEVRLRIMLSGTSARCSSPKGLTSVLILLIAIFQFAFTSDIMLTSSVEEQGSRVSCPGEKVTFTCTVLRGTTLQWISDAFSSAPQAFSLFHIDSAREPRTYGEFTARLTESVPDPGEPGFGDLTSSLTFTATPELNRTVIQCSNQLKIKSKTATFPDMSVISPPVNVRFEIQSFQHNNFTITVYWTYPYDNSEVDTVSLTVIRNNSRTIPVDQSSVNLTFPYNEVNTVAIKATRCSVTSEAATLNISKVSCGELTSPPSGYLNGYESTVEGSEIYYSCNTGLVPVEQMVTVCLANGEWTPNPAEHNCTQPSTYKCGDPGQPEGGSVKRTPEHLEVIYSCNPGFIPEGEMRSVCTENGSWVPDPNNVICHRYRPTASTVHCGYPQAPRGGHLVDNITTEEGSEVLYKCDEGLTPQGIMRALCTEGLWRPRPVDLICKSINSDQPSTTAATESELKVDSPTSASIPVVAIAVGITFIVTCVLGTIVGIFIWCITVKCKPTHCSKSMPKTPKQESEPEPIYETIMDFKDNVAYGIVQSPTSV